MQDNEPVSLDVTRSSQPGASNEGMPSLVDVAAVVALADEPAYVLEALAVATETVLGGRQAGLKLELSEPPRTLQRGVVPESASPQHAVPSANHAAAMHVVNLPGLDLSLLVDPHGEASAWQVAGQFQAGAASCAIRVWGSGDPPAGADLDTLALISLLAAERLRSLDAQEQRERHLRIVGNVAHAIHDLRSPVANSLGFLSLLRRALPEESQEQRWTDVALNELRRLRTMLAGLLEVTRSELGYEQIRPEPCDLVALLRQAAGILGEVAHREVQFDLPERLEIVGDPAALSKVITNLVENAIKYSPADSPIVVSLEEASGAARISIRDYGGGIPAEDLDSIFEPFVRGEATEADQPGLGLGLSICRSIVRAHGGHISVHSTPGEGSTFTVELPLVPASSPNHTASAE